jgi:hypothetical protein
LGVERSSQKNILEWKKRANDKKKSKKDKEEGP